MSDLTVLGTYGSVTEAELVRARLNAYGIDSIVQADDASGTFPTLGVTQGVRVLVRKEELADAFEAMERMLPGPSED